MTADRAPPMPALLLLLSACSASFGAGASLVTISWSISVQNMACLCLAAATLPAGILVCALAVRSVLRDAHPTPDRRS